MPGTRKYILSRKDGYVMNYSEHTEITSGLEVVEMTPAEAAYANANFKAVEAPKVELRRKEDLVLDPVTGDMKIAENTESVSEEPSPTPAIVSYEAEATALPEPDVNDELLLQ